MEVKETVAELQARATKLESKIAVLKGKSDESARAELKAANSELAEIGVRIESAQKDERITALEARDSERRERDADQAISRMVRSGKLQAREDELQASYKQKFIKDPELIALLAPTDIATIDQPVDEIQAGRNFGRATPSAITADARGRKNEPVSGYDWVESGGFDLKGAMKVYYGIIARNAAVTVNHMMGSTDRGDSYRKKGMLALEAANFYERVLKPNIKAWEGVPLMTIGELSGATRVVKGELQAGDVTGGTTDAKGNPLDPTNTLGTLSGTLVLQRTLPFFAYDFPELLSMYTDFSDTPGVYKQTEMTRIVSQLAVELYDNTSDGSGRPKGWSTVSPSVTTDAPISLTDYIGIPIVFGQEALSATTRRLFDEQSVLAIKAIAQYFIGMVTKLTTVANYNAYAVVGTPDSNGVNPVPIAYPSYPKAVADFSMSDIDAISAAFTSNKVPRMDRGVLLNPSYYAKLRGDPRLSFLYAASASTIAAAGDFLTEQKLPKLSGLAPYEAPYFPTTSNRVGFAFHKAGIMLKSRLPQDFTKALGTMIPGSVTTITDPDTKISIMLVQYVHLTQGFAEWRPEVILGAAVGDNRGGLVLTAS